MPLSDYEERLAKLGRWKEEATAVLEEWDRVHEALGSPGALGESKAKAAQQEVVRLKTIVRKVQT
jgi:hypothetical protein